MAGLQITGFDGGPVDEQGTFPLLYSTAEPLDSSAVQNWVASVRQSVATQLSRHGAVVFRGLGLADDAAFDAFVAGFDWPNFTYAESLSNAVRRNRTERVFTANEAPPDVSIFLHHEMAQTPMYPSRLFFFCEQPAQSGGATPICRSDWLLQQLAEEAPDFVHACVAKGVMYSQTMPADDDLASGQGAQLAQYTQRRWCRCRRSEAAQLGLSVAVAGRRLAACDHPGAARCAGVSRRQSVLF
jgi:hypothetical protein